MSLVSEDADPSGSHAAARVAAANQATGSLPNRVTFNRFELNRILNLYGRMVADGEWRDYAIDYLKDRAVFSVFRHACQVPIYRIEKIPRLSRRQGAYSVVSATGHIVRRGHDLDRVLRGDASWICDRQSQGERRLLKRRSPRRAYTANTDICAVGKQFGTRFDAG